MLSIAPYERGLNDSSRRPTSAAVVLSIGRGSAVWSARVPPLGSRGYDAREKLAGPRQ